MDKKKKMIELPPEQFKFGNYDGDIIPSMTFFDMDRLEKFIEEKAVGYQPHPAFRTKPDTVAVLFDVNGYESWCHISKTAFDILINRMKTRRDG